MILTYNYLENLANGKQYVRINGTNSALLIVTQWVAKGSILGPLLFITFINHLPSAMLISSLIIPSFRLVSTFPWRSTNTSVCLQQNIDSPHEIILEIKIILGIWFEDSKLIYQPERMARLKLKRINLQEKGLNSYVKGSFVQVPGR